MECTPDTSEPKTVPLALVVEGVLEEPMRKSNEDSGMCSDVGSDSSGSSTSDWDTGGEEERKERSLLDDDETNVTSGPKPPCYIKSKHEVAVDDIPLENIEAMQISEEVPIVLVGQIHSIVDKLVVVKHHTHTEKPAEGETGEVQTNAAEVGSTADAGQTTQKPSECEQDTYATASETLAEDTVLFSMDRTPLGRVWEVFGPVDTPYYSIRVAEISEAFKVGMKVFYTPESASYVVPANIKTKGYDASNEFDEELSASEQEFSDDEKEIASKRKKKRGTGKRKSGNSAKAVSASNQEAGYTPLQRPKDFAQMYQPQKQPNMPMWRQTPAYYEPTNATVPAATALPNATVAQPAPQPAASPFTTALLPVPATGGRGRMLSRKQFQQQQQTQQPPVQQQQQQIQQPPFQQQIQQPVQQQPVQQQPVQQPPVQQQQQQQIQQPPFQQPQQQQ